MRLTSVRLVLTLSAIAGLAIGCDNGGGTDAGTDSGHSADAGCPTFSPLPTGTPPDPPAACPTDNTPAPEEQMGSCCWRHSNADQLDTPELRLNYLQIVAPIGSQLATQTLTHILVDSMQQEHFNWLIRGEGTGGDGPVTITTGFGTRQADGTYAFSQGAGSGDPDTWCPVQMDATLAGETVTSEPIEGAVTVPVFDTTGTTLQLELTLREVEIDTATLSEDRSCIGWRVANFRYAPQGQLSGFIEVATAREGMINVPPVSTTVCSAIAGSLSDATYCDRDQSEWTTKPDSLCDESGCRVNQPCMSDVCDPATTCNAWHLVAQFAAAGVDITNSTCEGTSMQDGGVSDGGTVPDGGVADGGTAADGGSTPDGGVADGGA